jgi:hypothetical protein
MNSETACTKAGANKVAGISVSVGESNFRAIVRLVRTSLKPPPAKHACNPLAPPTPRNHSASPPRGETPTVGLRSLEFEACRRRYPKTGQVAI